MAAVAIGRKSEADDGARIATAGDMGEFAVTEVAIGGRAEVDNEGGYDQARPMSIDWWDGGGDDRGYRRQEEFKMKLAIGGGGVLCPRVCLILFCHMVNLRTFLWNLR